MPKEKDSALPIKVDPFRFADNKARLEGSLLISGMARLTPSLFATDGQVAVDLEFGIDEQKIRFARGHVATSLVLQCQRCLESFQYPMVNDFLLGIVKTEEEAEKLPDHYSPVIAAEGTMIIQDLVEDELIIGLPIVPMHAPQDCKVKTPLVADSDVVEESGANPFKVIEILRSKRTSK